MVDRIASTRRARCALRVAMHLWLWLWPWLLWLWPSRIAPLLQKTGAGLTVLSGTQRALNPGRAASCV